MCNHVFWIRSKQYSTGVTCFLRSCCSFIWCWWSCTDPWIDHPQGKCCNGLSVGVTPNYLESNFAELCWIKAYNKGVVRHIVRISDLPIICFGRLPSAAAILQYVGSIRISRKRTINGDKLTATDSNNGSKHSSPGSGLMHFNVV